MNRSIKFKMKNGGVVMIRSIKRADYDKVSRFEEEFLRGDGVKFTTQYFGQPKKDINTFVSVYENPNNFFIGAFDGNIMVGEANIQKQRPDHPQFQGLTGIVSTTVLDKYTSNGIGSKFLQILEKWAKENNVHRLEAKVRHTNNRSLGNLIKNDYNIIGIKHDFVRINGKYYHQYELEKILDK